jgi:hypothetical protein
MFGVVVLRFLLDRLPVPAPVNIFKAMGEDSSLFTHSFPWARMAFSVGAAAILFLVGLRVAQTREY